MGQVIPLSETFSDDFQTWEWQHRLSIQYPSYQIADYSGVNVVNNQGQTRLIRAAEQSDNAGIARYLGQGANPNLEVVYMCGRQVVYTGTNALLKTIEKENLEGSRLLLEAGANPNQCVFRTRAGLGSYTIYPADAFAEASPQMQALLLEYKIDPTRQGELARMAANSRHAEHRPPNA